MFSLPILTFHSLDDLGSVTSFSPRIFRRAIKKLHNNGYRALHLTDAVELLRHKRPLPERAFVITFDDGYQSVYTEGFPMLREYGMPATIFLTVGKGAPDNSTTRLPSLGGRLMLSWNEIREMAEHGCTFGAHTLTHPDLTRLPAEQATTEICRSKNIIEEQLSSAVICFAYPFGRYDRQTRAIVEQQFACACSDKLGLITKNSDPYVLERVDMYYLRRDYFLAIMLTRAFPWYIVARSIPRRLRARLATNLMRLSAG